MSLPTLPAGLRAAALLKRGSWGRGRERGRDGCSSHYSPRIPEHSRLGLDREGGPSVKEEGNFQASAAGLPKVIE